MTIRFVFIFIYLFLIGLTSYAQTIEHKPKYYIDAEGRIFWNKSMPIYLFASPVPDQVGQRLKSSSTPDYADPMYLDVEGLNYIRSRHAVDPVTKKVIEPKIEIHYEIYADGIAPITEMSFSGAKVFKTNNMVYYGPGLTLNVSASDQTSGVEQIYLKHQGNSFLTYDEEQIEVVEEGLHRYAYYASDNVGNAAAPIEKEFTLDLEAPFSNLNINGLAKDNIISENSTMYLLVSDSLSGVENTFFKFDSGAYEVYQGGKINVNGLKDGNHLISYYSVDKVANTEKAKQFSFYLDKNAPLMVSDVLGDKFIVDKKIYFSGRTKLKLTAVDNKIGVKDIMYSIDGEEFRKYEQPFYLPSISGTHEIRYYSVDKLDNRSYSTASKGGYETFKHNVSKVYIDLTGPTMKKPVFSGSSTYIGDTLLIGPYSSINLDAFDPESGLKEITYSVDGEVVENSYKAPFKITNEGVHRIEFFGYDNVNNRNISDLTVFVDATAPKIFAHFSHGAMRKNADGTPIYPNNVKLFLAATDARAGLDKIYYSINGGKENVYNDIIYNFSENKDFDLRIRAVDVLGNESVEQILFNTRSK